MATVVVHASAAFLGFNITSGSQVFMRARWATDPGALTQPPTVARTPANYSETPPEFVSATPTPDNPVLLQADVTWWEAIRDATRTVYSVVESRAPNVNTWSPVSSADFVVNHDPVANAGPDQLITLDAAGQLPADLTLDATATRDDDLQAATNPDPGPLTYRWWPTVLPASVVQNGAVWTGVHGVATQDDASPTLLAAGTPIPAGARGEYRFQLYVDDTDRAQVGRRRTQLGVGSSTTRVIIAADSPGLAILSPTTARPAFHTLALERGQVDVRIHYRVGATVAADPAYATGWVVRLTIRQEQRAPELFMLGHPPGTVVHQDTISSSETTGTFSWNGKMAAAGTPAATAIGSYTVELELLDSNAQPTGVAGATATESDAIVVDLVEWLLPVSAAFSQAALSGGFMESGHSGRHQTRLHTGIDIISTAELQPDLLCARSGIVQSVAGHHVIVDHQSPMRTEYLHGDNVAALAPGDMVLQGQRLARMSNQGGVPGIHLHFEYYENYAAAGGADTVINPLRIVPLRDTERPQLDDVRIRAAAPAGAAGADVAARLTRAATGIAGQADLIVRCRDRAHPQRNTPSQNGPFEVTVVEANGVGVWPTMRFDQMTAANLCEHYFESTGIKYPGVPAPAGAAMLYLPYLRWDTTAYARRTSPVRLEVTVRDFFGRASPVHRVVVGGEVAVTVPVPSPAFTAAAPQPFVVTLTITNRCEGLQGVASDTFAIALANAPAGWTIAAGNSSGAIQNSQARDVVVRINPNGVAARGRNDFTLVVTSGLLTQVGVQVPLSATGS